MKAPNQHVKMERVESSNITEIGYDQQTSTLYIRFKSGLYGYPRVSPAAHRELMQAESKGKHFNAMGIKADGVKITE